jgi:Beta-lactamase class C and other penicillin binding proteins
MSVLVLSMAGLLLCAPARADNLDRYIGSELSRQRIAGLSIAVIKDGKVVKAQGYGLANVETGTPATADTVYKIASVSKCFLAVAVMMLVEDSKLRLDDTIDRYFPDAPATWKTITIRQLLTHTSGIVEDPPGFAPFRSQPDIQVIRTLYPVPLLSKPGERWSYSNANYFIIADIIRQVSGVPWTDFVRDRIFRPLHMRETRTTTTTQIVPHRAEGYIWNENHFTRAEDWIAVRPSGAFLSTVHDLVKWDDAVRRRALLTPESWRQILSPVRLNDGGTYPYGFGFFLDPWQGHRQIHHEGQLPGFLAAYQTFPDDRLSVILLTNTDEIDQSTLARAIAGFYAPALSPPVYKALPDDPRITAKVKRFIASFSDGDPDGSLFPADMANAISGDLGLRTRVATKLRKWGIVASVTLVEHKPQGSMTSYRYRLAYKDSDSLLLDVTFDSARLIRGWGYDTDAAQFARAGIHRGR